MNSTLWGGVKYFSPNGEEISKEEYQRISLEYHRISQEYQRKVEAIKKKQKQEVAVNQTEPKSKMSVKSPYTAQGYDMFGNPTDDPSKYDSKGRPNYDKAGRWLTYPDSEALPEISEIPEIKWPGGYPSIKINDRTWRSICGLPTSVDGHEYIYKMDGWKPSTGKLYKDGKVVRIYKNGVY